MDSEGLKYVGIPAAGVVAAFVLLGGVAQCQTNSDRAAHDRKLSVYAQYVEDSTGKVLSSDDQIDLEHLGGRICDLRDQGYSSEYAAGKVQEWEPSKDSAFASAAAAGAYKYWC